MTVMIRGMHMEDIPAHIGFAALMNALFRMVDVLHGAGVTYYVTWLEQGVDLLCAGYIACERKGGRKPGVTLYIMHPAATDGNRDDRRVRKAIHRLARGAVRGPTRRGSPVPISVNARADTRKLATVTVDGRFAPSDAARVYAAVGLLSGVFEIKWIGLVNESPFNRS